MHAFCSVRLIQVFLIERTRKVKFNTYIFYSKCEGGGGGNGTCAAVRLIWGPLTVILSLKKLARIAHICRRVLSIK